MHEKEKTFIMTHAHDCACAQKNYISNQKCAKFECVVRIIMCDSSDLKQEYHFSNYNHALHFAYKKYHQYYENVKRIELLESLSYHLPLMVIEKVELANENLQTTT